MEFEASPHKKPPVIANEERHLNGLINKLGKNKNPLPIRELLAIPKNQTVHEAINGSKKDEYTVLRRAMDNSLLNGNRPKPEEERALIASQQHEDGERVYMLTEKGKEAYRNQQPSQPEPQQDTTQPNGRQWAANEAEPQGHHLAKRFASKGQQRY